MTQRRTSKATAPPPDGTPQEQEVVTRQYIAVKAVTLATGQTHLPGTTVAIADGDHDWPESPAALVQQGYLRAVEA